MNARKTMDKLIKEAGLSFNEVSKLSGYTHQAYSSWLIQGHKPSAQAFLDTIEALGYEIKIEKVKKQNVR